MKKLSIICAALVLTACGGSGGGNGTPEPLPTQSPPIAANPDIDAFYARVAGFVASGNETEEPGDITAVAVTEPDNTVPVEY